MRMIRKIFFKTIYHFGIFFRSLIGVKSVGESRMFFKRVHDEPSAF